MRSCDLSFLFFVCTLGFGIVFKIFGDALGMPGLTFTGNILTAVFVGVIGILALVSFLCCRLSRKRGAH